MHLEALVGGVVLLVGPDATLSDVANAMVDGSSDCVVVVNGRSMLGIVTERDIVRAVADGVEFAGALATAYMTPSPDVFSPSTRVDEAAKWLLETGYRHLPVVTNDEIVGVVTTRDLLFAMAD
ncbi:MAG: CBS domain-containing protein [Acidimicrobiia bacterium]|nr:CBS domain-containing protein [Acidimicrobiia bacterium]